MQIKFTVFFKNAPNNYCQQVQPEWFLPWQIIICIEFNFHEILTIFTLFTNIYCLNFIFNPIPEYVYFSNTSLFSSVESKSKYLLPFFYSICPSTLPIIRSRVITHFHNYHFFSFFNCDVSSIVNINVFVRFLVYF